MKVKLKKIKAIIWLQAVLFVLFSLVACDDNKGKRYTLPDVTENSTFDIIMKSYSGTAYVWSYKISPNSGIEYVSHAFISERENSDWTGGGQLKYTFRAVRTGNYNIEFEARIPSDEKQVPIERNIYEITIVRNKM